MWNSPSRSGVHTWDAKGLCTKSCTLIGYGLANVSLGRAYMFSKATPSTPFAFLGPFWTKAEGWSSSLGKGYHGKSSPLTHRQKDCLSLACSFRTYYIKRPSSHTFVSYHQFHDFGNSSAFFSWICQANTHPTMYFPQLRETAVSVCALPQTPWEVWGSSFP